MQNILHLRQSNTKILIEAVEIQDILDQGRQNPKSFAFSACADSCVLTLVRAPTRTLKSPNAQGKSIAKKGTPRTLTSTSTVALTVTTRTVNCEEGNTSRTLTSTLTVALTEFEF
jgi:carbohydrate-binding DOMON domain-containing protein